MKLVIFLVSMVSLASGYNYYQSFNGLTIIGNQKNGAAKLGNSGKAAGTLTGSFGSIRSTAKLPIASTSSSSRGLSGSVRSIQVAPTNQFAQQQQFQVIPIQLVQAAEVPSVQPTLAAPVQQQQIQLAVPVLPQPQKQVAAISAPQISSGRFQAVGSKDFITVAVQSRRTIQTIDSLSNVDAAVPPQIIIPANSQPIDIQFHSQSSPIKLTQVHKNSETLEPQVTTHQDPPNIVKTEIVKPILHEVIESIQPIRILKQEVRPVQETLNQLLTRGEQRQVQSQTVQGSTFGKQTAQAAQLVPVQIVGVRQTAATNLGNGGVAGSINLGQSSRSLVASSSLKPFQVGSTANLLASG